MHSNDLNQILAQWLDDQLAPNVYAVGTLKQRRSAYGQSGYGTILGSEDRYEAAYRQFMCRLSQSVYGRSTWRKSKTLLPCAATLEGNGEGLALGIRCPSKRWGQPKIQSGDRSVRYHLNMMFRRPDWISFEDFQSQIAEGWQKCPWAMPDIKIEERLGDCVSYSLKDGPETLITSALSFSKAH